jgi:hypothetical protein
MAVAARRLGGAARPLAELAPEAPAWLVETIECCMEPDADRRWPNAHALHDALTNARAPQAGGRAPSRGPQTAWERTARSLRRLFSF